MNPPPRNRAPPFPPIPHIPHTSNRKTTNMVKKNLRPYVELGSFREANKAAEDDQRASHAVLANGEKGVVVWRGKYTTVMSLEAAADLAAKLIDGIAQSKACNLDDYADEINRRKSAS